MGYDENFQSHFIYHIYFVTFIMKTWKFSLFISFHLLNPLLHQRFVFFILVAFYSDRENQTLKLCCRICYTWRSAHAGIDTRDVEPTLGLIHVTFSPRWGWYTWRSAHAGKAMAVCTLSVTVIYDFIFYLLELRSCLKYSALFMTSAALLRIRWCTRGTHFILHTCTMPNE
jgi:hypothetical protein